MENKPETLVILSPGFAANEADTSCMPPIQLFVKAVREVCPGVNVVVVTFHYPCFSGEYDWKGIKVIAVGGRNRGQLYRLWTWVKAWNVLRRLNQEYQFMGLLSFWLGECAFIGSRFAKRKQLAHYTWILGQDARRGNKYVSWIRPQNHTLIALSDFVAKEFRRNYGIRPAQVISVGIDTTLYGPAPAKRDVDILGAGSLIPLKQYHLFVGTIAFLKNTFPDIKAVICGKGPEIENLEALAAKLKVTDNLVFAGELPYAEVLAMMQRSKVFLHTSAYEGFGAVLAEALYAGAHVVSFCKPMDKEYRHHHVVSDTKEMNNEIVKILKNPKRGHDPVLMCTAQQVAKNVVSLFVD
ncbi:MAG TPA: glycosyltransferase [Mucilaginibacter sp.]|jgi:glycosyltransferase involved in cell wall biosynthesis|nr:glycosyltransferase [Mucilaginibacter sp.]